MNKKILIPLVVVIMLLIAGVAYLANDLNEQKVANQEMQELAEMDKKEMENEYQQFATQYSEMRAQITNDSIIAQLTAEQLKTERMLKELKEVKSSNAREITRLKKELATCRAVIRSYVLEIDSLNRLNQTLVAENSQVKAQYAEANRQIAGLSSEKANLSEKVAIAAQLDAIGIELSMLDKKNKSTSKVSKCKKLKLNFALAKNVTATSGNKTVYARITSPAGSVLGGAGSFAYENKNLQATAKKSVEYGGKETPITIYWDVTQALEAGTYHVSIFADGNMIGSRSFSFD